MLAGDVVCSSEGCRDRPGEEDFVLLQEVKRYDKQLEGGIASSHIALLGAAGRYGDLRSGSNLVPELYNPKAGLLFPVRIGSLMVVGFSHLLAVLVIRGGFLSYRHKAAGSPWSARCISIAMVLRPILFASAIATSTRLLQAFAAGPPNLGHCADDQ
jgi:hypothetical protein